MTSRFSFSLKGLFGITALAAMGMCVYSEMTWGVGASACVISSIGFIAFSLTFATCAGDVNRRLFWRASAIFSICYGVVVLGPYLASDTVDDLTISCLPLPSTTLVNLLVSDTSESDARRNASAKSAVDPVTAHQQRQREDPLRETVPNPFPGPANTADEIHKPLTFDEKVREIKSLLGGDISSIPPGMMSLTTGQVPVWLNRVYLAGHCWFLVIFACAFAKICVVFR